MTEQEWKNLVESVRDSECMIFLGAGSSTAMGGQRGLPTGSQLSQTLARQCDYPGVDKWDFLRVAQYYELVQSGHRLRKAIQREVDIDIAPGELHKLIAGLPIKYVLTTNYDRLMETAFRDAGKQVRVSVYDIHGTTQQSVDGATIDKPIVYKLHGTIDDLSTMLCTEDDIVQFLACIILGNPPLLQGIKQLFEDYTILFIGYGLRDWNIRTMIRAMRGINRRDRDWVKGFALQRQFDTSDAASADWQQSVMYWAKKENVNCLDVDAIEFVRELVTRVGAGRQADPPTNAATSQDRPAL
jgi:hypothetical protein